jgi:flagellar hook-length control protein FliK
MQALGEGLAVGARSVAIASSGGELGLVAQTAALDTASESAQTFGLGKKILGRNFAAASSVSTTEAWAARTASNQRLDAPHMTNVATTVVQAAVNNAQPQQQPHDWLPAGGGGLPTTSNEAMNAPGSDVLGGLLAGQGQGAGRGNDGGRGASAGQNPDAQGLYGLSGPSTDSATLAENPMFDLASALPTEDSVAEQVSYWVNQNIQNAELTIEHDGHPVQVTVSLNGNEAHVSFTSDQNETRALLDASVAQLRALLESQGLVLSGMSAQQCPKKKTVPLFRSSGQSESFRFPRFKIQYRNSRVGDITISHPRPK